MKIGRATKERAKAGARALSERASGVLLHPTSLPGPYGSGDVGREARAFVDELAEAGQRWWQMLPVGPVGYGHSPYSALSSFAGSPLLVPLDDLAEAGWLDPSALEPAPPGSPDRVDYEAAAAVRERALRSAAAALPGRPREERAAFEAFREENADWLDDWALYRALKRAHGERAFTAWAPELRARKRRALERARRELADEMAYRIFEQWAFDRAWSALREHCARRGVLLLGDVPIFVAHDSADVWQHPELFRLDERGEPTVVAGVPPDYFSSTGQLWGNPVYRWAELRRTGYAWWIARIAMALRRFDAVRLDHFIGFHRTWEVPASAPTAEIGRYVKGPGDDLFRALRRALGALPFVAEDLGVVTPEVKELRDEFGLPGIRVLQFAFGDDPSAPDFLPHNYPRRAVVYTGTHDNDTTVGWFEGKPGEASTRTPEQIAREREAAMRYLASDGRSIHWDMIRMAHLSVAGVSIVPAQDLLGLGSEARMNRPGRAEGNWEWRMRAGALRGETMARFAELTRTYGRWSPAAGNR